MAEKVYPKGIKVFSPRQGAPDFVKGTIVISPDTFLEFIQQNPGLLSEYNNESQLKLQLLEGNKGLYLVVDTYKKTDY